MIVKIIRNDLMLRNKIDFWQTKLHLRWRRIIKSLFYPIVRWPFKELSNDVYYQCTFLVLFGILKHQEKARRIHVDKKLTEFMIVALYLFLKWWSWFPNKNTNVNIETGILGWSDLLILFLNKIFMRWFWLFSSFPSNSFQYLKSCKSLTSPSFQCDYFFIIFSTLIYN